MLNSRFCSFKFFHWYQITFNNLKRFHFRASYFDLPLFEVEAHFSGENDRNLLALYKTMYVQRALRSKVKYYKLRLLRQ